ncbi:hypothetical protein FPV67DRAFT_1670545 [Lyophyllum atratum]|nr:hypothetical protein FPV67DRAFT_1670545 [Lyophyllum atratum]
MKREGDDVFKVETGQKSQMPRASNKRIKNDAQRLKVAAQNRAAHLRRAAKKKAEREDGAHLTPAVDVQSAQMVFHINELAQSTEAVGNSLPGQLYTIQDGTDGRDWHDSGETRDAGEAFGASAVRSSAQGSSQGSRWSDQGTSLSLFGSHQSPPTTDNYSYIPAILYPGYNSRDTSSTVEPFGGDGATYHAWDTTRSSQDRGANCQSSAHGNAPIWVPQSQHIIMGDLRTEPQGSLVPIDGGDFREALRPGEDGTTPLVSLESPVGGPTQPNLFERKGSEELDTANDALASSDTDGIDVLIVDGVEESPRQIEEEELLSRRSIVSTSGLTCIEEEDDFDDKSSDLSSVPEDFVAIDVASGRIKDFVTPVRGVQLSSEAPVIHWPGDVRTCVPFIPEDEDVVRRMAACPGSRVSPFITHMEMDPLPFSAVGECRRLLAKGDILVLRDSIMRENRDFREYMVDAPINGETLFDVHDSSRRLLAGEPNPRISLDTFLEGTCDPKSVQCILSVELDLQSVPWIVSKLDDGYSWGYNNLPEILKGERLVGDFHRARSWALLHHAGVLTFIHHDAEGLLTFIRILIGGKMWGIVRPKDYENATTCAELDGLQDELFDIDTPPSDHWQRKWEEKGGSMYTIDVQAGDLVVMPPGSGHMVFTPICTISVGGHLTMYDTLHLTEVSRAYDVKKGLTSTNTSHMSVYVMLCGMAVGILTRPKTRVLYTKCIRALCRMVLHPKAYIPDAPRDEKREYTKELERLLRESDIVKSGLLVASRIDVGMGWKCTGKNDTTDRDFLFQGGSSWMDPGEEIDEIQLAEVVKIFEDTVLWPGKADSGIPLKKILSPAWKRKMTM